MELAQKEKGKDSIFDLSLCLLFNDINMGRNSDISLKLNTTNKRVQLVPWCLVVNL